LEKQILEGLTRKGQIKIKFVKASSDRALKALAQKGTISIT
jgi:hypothetical protein